MILPVGTGGVIVDALVRGDRCYMDISRDHQAERWRARSLWSGITTITAPLIRELVDAAP